MPVSTAIGVLSNSDVGIQYHVSGLAFGDTLRFNITDAHPDTAHNPGPATESASTTAPGSGSHQVNYVVPVGITEKSFLIESSTNMALVDGTTYYVVLASINYVPYYATGDGHVLQYLAPPADDFYRATVNHGNKLFKLSANPVSQPTDKTDVENDVHNVNSYLVTIYEHTTTGVSSGKVWQKAYPATNGILDYAGTDTSITIDCMQIIYVEGTTSAQIAEDPTANVQFAAMELFNSKNYELIVAARNATGTVKTAQTFHVSPRETPNAVQLTVTSGSYTRPLTSGSAADIAAATAAGIGATPYNNTAALPNSNTTDNKIEFSITLGDKAGPNGNEHDFAVIVKLTGGTHSATPLYKRINLSNYITTDVPSAGNNSNSTDNGVTEATDLSKFEKLTSQLVASGHAWSTNDNGLLTDGTVSLVDGTEYYLAAKAINIMTTKPGFEASDSPLNTGFDNTSGVTDNGPPITGNIKVTPSGLPIVPTFTDPSTHVGHLTNTIQIRLNGNEINSVMGDEGANGNNGSDILWYYLTVNGNDAQTINFTWVPPADSVAGYSYYDITTDGTTPLVNGTSYTLKLEAVNSNGYSDVLTGASRAVTIDNITPRTDPAAVLNFDAWPDNAEESILSSGEVGVKVDAFTTPAGTGGDEIANISYQFQLSSTNDFSNTPVRDVSGVGTTSTTFTGLVDGVQYYVRARAINSVWTNAILDSPTNDSSGNNDTDDNASGGPWTVYATGVGVTKTVTPSVPPTVDVGVMTTIADRIVTHSHFHTGDNFGLKVKLGGEATTTTGTTGAGAANADYIVNGIRVTATALSGIDTSFTDIPSAEYTTDKEIAVLAPTDGNQGKEDFHFYKLSFQAYNNTYPAGSTNTNFTTVESTSDGHAHLTNATLPFVLTTQQTGDHVVGSKAIEYNWSVEDWTAADKFHYPMSDGYDWTRTENAPTLNTTTNKIALAGSWTSPSLGSSDVAGQGTGNLSASSTTGSYSSTGLRDGTSYKFAVVAKAKSQHPLVTSLPTSYTEAVSESTPFIPYSKPTVALIGTGADAKINIRSNGRVLEDSIVVRAVASTLAIDNITTAVHNSTKAYTDGSNGSALTAAGPYFEGGNPGFTNYFDGTDFASELISVVDGPAAAGYLLLSENAGGATVILNGSITGTNLVA